MSNDEIPDFARPEYTSPIANEIHNRAYKIVMKLGEPIGWGRRFYDGNLLISWNGTDESELSIRIQSGDYSVLAYTWHINGSSHLTEDLAERLLNALQAVTVLDDIADA